MLLPIMDMSEWHCNRCDITTYFRGDMTETYKFLSGIYNTIVLPEIPIISEYATRGNSLKIANRRCNYNL